jgi:tetratricopeptide (TPR) repeat protein
MVSEGIGDYHVGSVRRPSGRDPHLLPEEVPVLTGTVVAARFLLGAVAGTGGMGTVFRALDQERGLPVALKILRGRAEADVARFEREATFLAGLDHPGIVRYVAHGVTAEGDRYLAMEWLEGEDLGERLRRRPLSLAESVTLLRGAADALAVAHARGMIHRDVKPSNVFLVGGDVARLKLVDFGIALGASDARRLTNTGVLLGTLGYTAPEQVEKSVAPDPRTDVFSLGCVLFECLARRPAFEGTHAFTVLAKILLQDVPRLHDLRSDVPAPLGELVARMMDKDPAARPADAGAVAAALAQLDVAGLSLSPGDGWAWGEGAEPAKAASLSGPLALTWSEQRVVSVVLAGDLNAEARDHGSLAAAIDDLEAAVAAHGGQLVQLSGSSLVVTLWSSGSAVDRAVRAALCALVLRAHLPAASICVVTGRGLVEARRVEGDVLDRCAYTLQNTPLGMIRIDEVTALMLGSRFVIDATSRDYFLWRESPLDESTPLLLGKPTPCVGRGRELAMLEGLLDGCIAESVASAVLLTGPAGAGKSRLRREFVERAQRRGAPLELLVGRGDSLGRSPPFGMIGEAIRRAVGIHWSDPVELGRQKLLERLGRRFAQAELLRVAAFLGELSGTPFPDDTTPGLIAARAEPLQMGDAIRAVWEDWLVAECQAGPTLLVLEDLQWSDAATVRLLDSTLRNLGDLPLMVLLLARDDVHVRFPGLLAERGVQTIRLAPLSRRSSESLIRSGLGSDAAADVVGRILDRGAGNPFFLEELVRAVAAGRGDVLPDSVQGTVEARLDAQGVEARLVLRAASLFGDRFSNTGVVAVLSGGPLRGSVPWLLDGLVAHELIGIVSTGRVSEEIEYVFRHAIVREAAYAMLTEADRALGHRLAGEWLERVGRADAMVLAEHFDRGGELSRAAPWYRRAAEQALEANDLGAAFDRAERGLACAVSGEGSGEDCGELHRVAAEAYLWRGELALAEERGLEAATYFAEGSPSWLRAITQVSLAAGKLGAYDRVESWAARVGGASATLEARAAQLACLCQGVSFLVFAGRHGAADRVMAVIDRIAEQRPAPEARVAALLLQARAIRDSAMGNPGACLESFEAALAAFEALDDRRNAAVMRSNVGFMRAEMGDFEGAEAALRSAHAAALRMGLHDVAISALQNLGYVLAHRGRLDEARQIEQRVVDTFCRLGDVRMEGMARTYLAGIAYLAGDLDASEREARAAAGVLEIAPPRRIVALAQLARTLMARGRAEESLVAAREAHATLELLGAVEEGESFVRLVHAEALLAAGLAGEAAAAIASARERLLARADRIEDRIRRERFLTNVPDNARTLELRAPGDPERG